MNNDTRIQPIKSALARYQKVISALKEKYTDYPMVVAFETLTKCNASCDFCPYADSPRKGQRMSDELVDKIIHEMEDIPRTHPFRVNLSKLNEPFLDSRIFDIISKINQKVPHAKMLLCSNGSPFNENMIDKLSDIENAMNLNVSLNEWEKDKYENSMGLPWELVIRNLKLLHDAKKHGKLKYPVQLSRVASGTEEDDKYVSFVHDEFPEFVPTITEPFDWIGSVEMRTTDDIPAVACAQWFALNICSNGKVAHCCIDADGNLGKYNVKHEHILDIYNKPEKRKMRLGEETRVGHPICGHCTFGFKKGYPVGK